MHAYQCISRICTDLWCIFGGEAAVYMLSDGASQASRLRLDAPAVALRIAEQQGRGRTWLVKDVGILKNGDY